MKQKILKVMLWIGIAAVMAISMIALGGFAGNRSGQAEVRNWAATQSTLSIDEQFKLAKQDLEAGRIELAQQRLTYVLQKNPSYPGAMEKLGEVLLIAKTTIIPTVSDLTIATVTPTRDLRPVEDLYTQIQTTFQNQDWNKMLDLVVSVRQTDPAYKAAELDGLIYLALRNRGVDKIFKHGDLEGGIYDLALAEKFAPLDSAAVSAQTLARFYMIGLSFWEVMPDQAVYYFSQVVAAAPNLGDGTGWTASSRYQAALVQYADQMAKSGDWCGAQTNYNLALSLGGDSAVQSTAAYAGERCSPPTATTGATSAPTATTLAPTNAPTAVYTNPPVVPTTQPAPVQTTEPPPVQTTEPPPVQTTEPAPVETTTQPLSPASTTVPAP